MKTSCQCLLSLLHCFSISFCTKKKKHVNNELRIVREMGILIILLLELVNLILLLKLLLCIKQFLNACKKPMWTKC